MIFYFWNDINVTLSRSEAVMYHCEKCGEMYYFEGHVTVTGSGHSAFMADNEGATRRAKRQAKEAIRRVFEEQLFPVPCPTCGCYQRECFPTFRRGLYGRMYLFALALSICAMPAYLVVALVASEVRGGAKTDSFDSLLGGLCGAGCMLLAITCLGGMFFLRRLYDPNARIPEATRIAYGRAMSVPSADLPQPLPQIDVSGKILGYTD